MSPAGTLADPIHVKVHGEIPGIRGSVTTAGTATVSGSVTSSPAVRSTAAVAGVAENASDVELIAANANRRGLIIHNAPQATNVLYVKFGGAASIASGGYTVAIPANTSWPMPEPVYTGALHFIWSGAGSGFANVTEIT